MSWGEITFLVCFAILAIIGAYRSARRGRSQVFDPTQQQVQDDVARMRQIAEYERWGKDKYK